MGKHRRTLLGGVLVFAILAGAGIAGITTLCDYTPHNRTSSVAAFMETAGEYAPNDLIHAAQADVQRELGIKGQTLPGSTVAIYHCEDSNCRLQRLIFSVVINPRCPLPRDTVTAVDYDFRLDHDQLDTSSRTVVTTRERMLSHWQDSPTSIDDALDIMVASVPPDFSAAYHAFSVSLNAVDDHWDVLIQPADSTSTVLLGYQISYKEGLIRSISGE